MGKSEKARARASGKISFQINDNYIELKTKIHIYKYIHITMRNVRDTADKSNRMPNTHTHTQPNMQGIYTTNKPVIKVIDFFLPEEKKKKNTQY